MGLTLTEKILKAHLVEGEMVKGSEIGIRIDQRQSAFPQDRTGYRVVDDRLSEEVASGAKDNDFGTFFHEKTFDFS